MAASVAAILAQLPQTQCRRCGYADCAAYAQAIAAGAAAINQCPPGGAQGVLRLAGVTGAPPLPLDPAHGQEAPRSVAVVVEQWCIGCTLCIKACPTDAIVGSNKRMHSVIEAYCSGCDLCLPVCPVDCIDRVNVSGNRSGWDAWSQAQADEAAQRYAFNSYRRRRDADENAKRLINKAQIKLADLAQHSQHTDPLVLEQKRAIIQAALARTRARLASTSS